MMVDGGERDRQRWLREISDAVASVIASAETVDVDGNLYVPKPALVAALARYDAQSKQFVEFLGGLSVEGVELVPEVVEVMRYFEPENGGPFPRPGVTVTA